jgi:hypothetical protein
LQLTRAKAFKHALQQPQGRLPKTHKRQICCKRHSSFLTHIVIELAALRGAESIEPVDQLSVLGGQWSEHSGALQDKPAVANDGILTPSPALPARGREPADHSRLRKGHAF